MSKPAFIKARRRPSVREDLINVMHRAMSEVGPPPVLAYVSEEELRQGFGQYSGYLKAANELKRMRKAFG